MSTDADVVSMSPWEREQEIKRLRALNKQLSHDLRKTVAEAAAEQKRADSLHNDLVAEKRAKRKAEKREGQACAIVSGRNGCTADKQIDDLEQALADQRERAEKWKGIADSRLRCWESWQNKAEQAERERTKWSVKAHQASRHAETARTELENERKRWAKYASEVVDMGNETLCILKARAEAAESKCKQLQALLVLCKVDDCEEPEYCGGLCVDHFNTMDYRESEALTVAKVEREEFTLPEIDETIKDMEERLANGGDKAMAQCRLSLPMTHWLRLALAAEQHLREDAEYRRDLAEQNTQIAREISERLRRQRDNAHNREELLRQQEK